MAFVKLDCNIVDSTLWVERDGREVFITALLMAMPREFTEPVQQISVDSTDYTGFEVPAGWYGFVPASGPGIVRRAMVEPEAGKEALRMLGSPDAASRSSDYDGRRMIRVDGGYLILNYIKYREKDHTAAKRQERYRLRKKEKSNAVTEASNAVTSRNVTQAEAEADGIEKQDISTPIGVEGETKDVSPCPVGEIVKLYHELLPMLPKVEKITKTRAGYIKQRWREDLPDLTQWRNFFTFVGQSPFLTGKVNGHADRPPFRADIEWLCKPSNFTKISEEKYHRV